MLPSPRLSPDEAKQQLDAGAFVLALGVPPGTEFGMDCRSFATGEHFMGVKMVPPGLHLVHCSNGGQQARRSGCFVRLRRGDVIVRRWSTAEEDLRGSSAQEAEARATSGTSGASAVGGTDDADSAQEQADDDNIAAAARRCELDRALAPYSGSFGAKAWGHLTAFISDAVLARCRLACGRRLIAAGPAEEAALRTELQAAAQRLGGRSLEDGGGANASSSAGGAACALAAAVAPEYDVPHFTDTQRYRLSRDQLARMTPHARTRYELDGTDRVEAVLAGAFVTASGAGKGEGHSKGEVRDASEGEARELNAEQIWTGTAWQELLGELQLAFVLFLTLSSLAALEQWKRLLALLCSCERGAGERPAHFAALVRVVHAQVHCASTPSDGAAPPGHAATTGTTRAPDGLEAVAIHSEGQGLFDEELAGGEDGDDEEHFLRASLRSLLDVCINAADPGAAAAAAAGPTHSQAIELAGRAKGCRRLKRVAVKLGEYLRGRFGFSFDDLLPPTAVEGEDAGEGEGEDVDADGSEGGSATWPLESSRHAVAGAPAPFVQAPMPTAEAEVEAEAAERRARADLRHAQAMGFSLLNVPLHEAGTASASASASAPAPAASANTLIEASASATAASTHAVAAISAPELNQNDISTSDDAWARQVLATTPNEAADALAQTEAVSQLTAVLKAAHIKTK